MQAFEQMELLEALEAKAMGGLKTLTLQVAVSGAKLKAKPFPVPEAVVDACRARGITLRLQFWDEDVAE